MFNLLRVIVALTLIRATERFLYSVRSTCIGLAGCRWEERRKEKKKGGKEKKEGRRKGDTRRGGKETV